jgi:hypothetical protein
MFQFSNKETLCGVLFVKLLFVALGLSAGGAAIAGDQSVWYGQQTPTSSGLNQQNLASTIIRATFRAP